MLQGEKQEAQKSSVQAPGLSNAPNDLAFTFEIAPIVLESCLELH